MTSGPETLECRRLVQRCAPKYALGLYLHKILNDLWLRDAHNLHHSLCLEERRKDERQDHRVSFNRNFV